MVISVEARKFQVLDFVFLGCDYVEERWRYHGLCPESVTTKNVTKFSGFEFLQNFQVLIFLKKSGFRFLKNLQINHFVVTEIGMGRMKTIAPSILKEVTVNDYEDQGN